MGLTGQVEEPVSAKHGGIRIDFEVCPCRRELTDGSQSVFEREDGTKGFKCFHENNCPLDSWRDLRAYYDPDYDPEVRAGGDGRAGDPRDRGTHVHRILLPVLMTQQRRYFHLTTDLRLTLKRGDTGPPVKELQKDLQRLGYYQGALDGLYGPKTAAAVRALQADMKLAPSIETASGQVTPRTAAVIMHAMKQQAGITLVPQSTGQLPGVTVTGEETGPRIAGLHPLLLAGGAVGALLLGAIVAQATGARKNPGLPDDEATVFRRKKANYSSKDQALRSVVRLTPYINDTGDLNELDHTDTHYVFKEKGL